MPRAERDGRPGAEAGGRAPAGAEIEVGKLISFVSHPYEHYVVGLFL
jgi:hypothetical protein